MQAVILAGGTQSTINNEYEGIPKPMVEIGGRPLLWHIMQNFSRYGIKDFIICGGYKIDVIKQYFTDYYIYESDITIDLQSNSIQIHKKKTENWNVSVIDTGLYSSPGKRISMIEKYINEDAFLVSYGDCLSNINITELVETHKLHGKCATLTMAKPIGRNKLLPMNKAGKLKYDAPLEEIRNDAWINADCLVFNKEVFQYIHGNFDLEEQLLVALSKEGQIGTYCHTGYWRAIETRRDLLSAENLWNKKQAPWINWD